MQDIIYLVQLSTEKSYINLRFHDEGHFWVIISCFGLTGRKDITTVTYITWLRVYDIVTTMLGTAHFATFILLPLTLRKYVNLSVIFIVSYLTFSLVHLSRLG